MHRSDMLRILTIILLNIVPTSQQTVYSCDSSASCGCSTQPVSISRIVGGENAGTATWGWVVSISIDDAYLCGGSIISSSWVITAAHCVTGYTASQITIYAGSTTRFSGTQIRVGSNLIVHPDYDFTTENNDIALLQLASPLSMSDPYVSAICLPSVSASTLLAGEWPPVGTSVVAVGWGTLSEGGTLPMTLQQVTVETVAYNAPTCVGYNIDWQVKLCAGVSGGGKDTCQGDSGGPLMMFSSDNQWVLIGITSSGTGCARATNAGLYTRVAAFEEWINSNINDTVTPMTTSASAINEETTTSAAAINEETTTTTPFSIIDSHACRVKTSAFAFFVFILFRLVLIHFY